MGFKGSQPILCGRCRIPVERSTETTRLTTVCCPNCGQTDTLEDARREAAQHTAHKLLSAMLRTNDQPELYFRFVEGDDRRPAQAKRGLSSDRTSSGSFPR